MTDEQKLKIKELTEGFEIQNRIDKMLSFPVFTKKYYDKSIMVWPQKNLDPEKATEMLDAFPPTRFETNILKSVISSPYRLILENPCSISRFSSFTLKVGWVHEELELHFNIPVEYVKDFTLPTSRHITDSEYHYFTGTDIKYLTTMMVPRRVFNRSQVINWYGGDQTLLCVDTINKILESIKTNKSITKVD